MSDITAVQFEQSDRGGYIAKDVFDGGPWIVPGNRERHATSINENDLYLVEVTGVAKSGRLRFCKVLLNVYETVLSLVEGGRTSIENIITIGNDEVYVVSDLLAGFFVEVKLCVKYSNGEMKSQIRLQEGGNKYEFLGVGLKRSWKKIVPQFEVTDRLKRLIDEYKREKQRKYEELRRKQDEILQGIVAKALTYDSDELANIVKELAEQAIQKGSSRVLTQKEEGLLGGLSLDEKADALDQIVNGLNLGDFKAVLRRNYPRENGDGYFVKTVERSESKRFFLEDHPDADLQEDDPQFWAKACEIAGEYLYTSEAKSYCLVNRYKVYRILVRGVALIKSVYVGNCIDEDDDDRPTYL